MIFTFEEYGKTHEQLAKDIRKFKLFPLLREELHQQVYLAPYIALGKEPEVVIAIGKSIICFIDFHREAPNKTINQYGDFIILSKREMLEVCQHYIQLDAKIKKEFLEHANKK